MAGQFFRMCGFPNFWLAWLSDLVVFQFSGWPGLFVGPIFPHGLGCLAVWSLFSGWPGCSVLFFPMFWRARLCGPFFFLFSGWPGRLVLCYSHVAYCVHGVFSMLFLFFLCCSCLSYVIPFYFLFMQCTVGPVTLSKS